MSLCPAAFSFLRIVLYLHKEEEIIQRVLCISIQLLKTVWVLSVRKKTEQKKAGVGDAEDQIPEGSGEYPEIK